jgi:hypothetical protein
LAKKAITPKSRKTTGPEVIRITEGVEHKHFIVPIEGTGVLVMDRLSERVRDILRIKTIGLQGKVEVATPATPEGLFLEAMYRLNTNGKRAKKHKITVPFVYPGEKNNRTFTAQEHLAFPSIGLKKALIAAGRGLEGIEMSKIKVLIMVQGHAFPIEFKELTMEEVWSRNGMNKVPVVKWLPHVYGWKAEPMISLVHPAVSIETLVHLVNAAGVLGGIGVRRAELGGIQGGFRIDASRKIREVSHKDAVAYNYQYRLMEEVIEYVQKNGSGGGRKKTKKVAGKKRGKVRAAGR